MKRLITITASGSVSSYKWGFVGEKDETHISIEVPEHLVNCDYLQAELVIKGKKHTTDNLEIVDGCVTIVIPLKLTKKQGRMTVQLVGYVVDDEGNIGAIGKSDIFSGDIFRSVDGVEEEGEETPTLLQRIWTKIQAWADKIHEHGNIKTLNNLICESANDKPGDIIIDYDGRSRVKYGGDCIRFVRDGAVINKVDEIQEDGQTVMRLWLESGPGVVTNFDVPTFLDIPVAALVEKEAEDAGTGLGIGTNSGLSLDLGLGSVETEIAELQTIVEEIRFRSMSVGGREEIETTISPNRHYDFGTPRVLTVTLKAGHDRYLNEYLFTFVSGTTPTTLTLPASVKWGNGNELTVEANKRYEISIVDDIALWCSVDIEVSA